MNEDHLRLFRPLSPTSAHFLLFLLVCACIPALGALPSRRDAVDEFNAWIRQHTTPEDVPIEAFWIGDSYGVGARAIKELVRRGGGFCGGRHSHARTKKVAGRCVRANSDEIGHRL